MKKKPSIGIEGRVQKPRSDQLVYIGNFF